jgi:hypothetical protein
VHARVLRVRPARLAPAVRQEPAETVRLPA